MRNIDKLHLSETSFEIFENVINGKNKDNKIILESIKDQISDLYDNYNCNLNNLAGLSPKGYKDEEKKALLSCYDNTIANKDIKAEIRKLGHQKCPYCNIDNSREVEHFVPKEEFPEFAFLIDNLLPSCGTCNGIKGTTWREGGATILLNAFHDNIPGEQFLFVELDIQDNTLTSKFYIDTSNITIEPGIESILNTHVEKLNLMDRYSCIIDTKISEIKALNLINTHTVESLKDVITIYETQGILYGNNYREKVLYNEISNNDKILTYLINN